MSYFNALGLEEEPFSNTPNPEFFYHVPARVEVLNLLEVSVRLRRGLNVVLGEVGTGKTTMCRQFIRYLGEDDMFVTFLLLDPYFASPLEFLRVFYGMLFRMPAPVDASEWQLKEEVKSELLHRTMDRNQVVTLILDEGQKIQDHCLELLRELLNFETNQNKLLQIVIFAQSEFHETLKKYENLVDRVDSLHKIKPLNFLEMRDMIRYRLELAGSGEKPPELFTTGAYWAIYHLTRGYPRKVIALCHKTMLALLMLGRSKATLAVVYKAAGRNVPHVRWGAAGAVCAGCVAAAFLYVTPPTLSETPLEATDTAISSDTARLPQQAQQEAESRAETSVELEAEATANDSPAKKEQAGQPPELRDLPSGSSDLAALDSEKSAEEWAPLRAETESTMPPLTQAVSQGEPQQTSDVKAAAGSPEDAKEPQAAQVAAVQTRSAPAEPLAASDKQASSSAEDVLGVIPLAKGELLSRAIGKVYGMYRTAYLEKLLQANPHIKDPDRVAAGTMITYPTIVEAQGDDMGEGYWLRLDSYPSLPEAVQAMNTKPLKGLDVRLLPVSDSSGMRFHVVAATRFRKESQARGALATFPQEVQDQALVVRHWEPGAVLFTDRAVWGEALAKR